MTTIMPTDFVLSHHHYRLPTMGWPESKRKRMAVTLEGFWWIWARMDLRMEPALPPAKRPVRSRQRPPTKRAIGSHPRPVRERPIRSCQRPPRQRPVWSSHRPPRKRLVRPRRGLPILSRKAPQRPTRLLLPAVKALVQMMTCRKNTWAAS